MCWDHESTINDVKEGRTTDKLALPLDDMLNSPNVTFSIHKFIGLVRCVINQVVDTA